MEPVQVVSQSASYYRARDDDPQNGSFLYEDPTRFKTNLNFYPYAIHGGLESFHTIPEARFLQLLRIFLEQ
jgi:hypothetical protein